ncbi:MAG: hypothetical protein QG629_121 [Patescibacteria group bacterium]|nr:hypothetical protein [Patescibacteria group bacterium]
MLKHDREGFGLKRQTCAAPHMRGPSGLFFSSLVGKAEFCIRKTKLAALFKNLSCSNKLADWVLIAFEHNGKRFCWDVYFAKAFHAFFAFGLFGKHLFLA